MAMVDALALAVTHDTSKFILRLTEMLWTDNQPTKNRSPKGNMCPAIPVALLCMVVNWSERKQGSVFKWDKVL